jgi:rsbT co-antagonist protein RsbR
LLGAIDSQRAKVVALDITGVPDVDSTVANHLMEAVIAARLMGALTILTGVSAEVAQALGALNIELGVVHIAGDLQGGLEEAERLLGKSVVSGGADR